MIALTALANANALPGGLDALPECLAQHAKDSSQRSSCHKPRDCCQHYGRGLGKVPAGKSSLSGADGIPRELEYLYRGAGAGASLSPAASASRWWAPAPAVSCRPVV